MIQINQHITPKILQVDASGLPKKWITIEDAVGYYARNMVIFELGNSVATYRGGINRQTEIQSEITTNSIIGIRGAVVRQAEIQRIPTLTNDQLFNRDRHLCAYCGNVYHDKALSRDHVTPICQNGEDNWMNVVTACIPCNNYKGGRNLEQSQMSLLYLPYIPDRYESFILEQGVRHILADQMEFLLKKVQKTSRFKS